MWIYLENICLALILIVILSYNSYVDAEIFLVVLNGCVFISFWWNIESNMWFWFLISEVGEKFMEKQLNEIETQLKSFEAEFSMR